MLSSVDELICLACGEQIEEPLRRAASLRCHDCRASGQPISFELALRVRALRQLAADTRNDDSSVGWTAA